MIRDGGGCTLSYKRLDRLFHENTSSNRKSENEHEAQTRLTAPSSFRTGIDVGTGELFLAVPRELSIATEKILRAERKASHAARTYATSSSTRWYAQTKWKAFKARASRSRRRLKASRRATGKIVVRSSSSSSRTYILVLPAAMSPCPKRLRTSARCTTRSSPAR